MSLGLHCCTSFNYSPYPNTSHQRAAILKTYSTRVRLFTRTIFNAENRHDPIDWPPNLYSKVLRYRLCTAPVLDIITTRCAAATNLDKFTELPKHFFRRLDVNTDEPLPFLRQIEANPVIPPLNVNAHNGFALTMAVHASFIPLIHYLLALGANPDAKHAIAVIVAIRKKDLQLVRLLIEPLQYRSKRPRIPKRILPSERPELLKVAIQVDARDIVDYLREKGCVPDLGMIKLLGSYSRYSNDDVSLGTQMIWLL
ncbi:hypothetical protein CPB85DRAFT_1562042 [Mucidula mucida]|nr:hypothetical protein CPB85DRAFT_1562042 [Mucidula mucida]